MRLMITPMRDMPLAAATIDSYESQPWQHAGCQCCSSSSQPVTMVLMWAKGVWPVVVR